MGTYMLQMLFWHRKTGLLLGSRSHRGFHAISIQDTMGELRPSERGEDVGWT